MQVSASFNARLVKHIDIANSTYSKHTSSLPVKKSETGVNLVNQGSLTQRRFFMEYQVGYLVLYDLKAFKKKAIQVAHTAYVQTVTCQSQLYLQNCKLALSGGIDTQGVLSDSIVIFTVSPETYAFSQESQGLLERRHGHRMVLMEDVIYILGGENQKGQLMRHCETIQLSTLKGKEIKRMNLKRSNFLVQCNHNTQTIYVMGGTSADISSGLLTSLEIFSP